MMKYPCWIFLFLSQLFYNLPAQEKLIFNKLDKSDGVSNNTIYDIVQDSSGYIWFATANGLNKFDGKEFFIFKSNNVNALKSNNVRCLLIDKKDNLWIGTIGGGLYILEKSDNHIHLITDEILEIHDIIEDKSHGYWVGAREGLFYLEMKSPQKYSLKKYANQDVQSVEQYKGKVWFGAASGVFCIDLESGIISEIKPELLNNEYIFDISFVKENELWIASRHQGLLIFDVNSKQLVPFTQQYKSLSVGSFLHNPIKDVRVILKGSGNQVYIGTDGDGLLVMDLLARKFTRNVTGLNPFSISSNTVYSVFEDRDQNIWLGHVRKGVSIIDNNRDRIKVYFNPEEIRDFSSVLSIFQDKDNNYYFGTDGKGLYKFQPKGASLQYPEFNQIIGDAYVQSIYIDRTNNVWIGTFSKGLIVYSPKGKKIELPFYVNDVRNILEDSLGNIWIATYGKGFLFYDPGTTRFKNFRHLHGEANSLSHDNVMAMSVKGNNIYLATFGGGVDIFNLKSGVFKHFKHDDRDPYSLLDNNVISLFVNSEKDIWIGSSSGITHLSGDMERPLVTNYSFNQLSFDRNLAGIAVDDSNQIWISTDAGVYKLKREDSTFIKVNLGSLFNNSEFHLNALLKTKNNHILFGAEDGVFAFDPVRVFDRSIPSDVYITNLLVNGRADNKAGGMNYFDNLKQEGQLKLTASENILTIEYSALQFPNSSGIEYAIKMENIDDNWRAVGRNRTATYSNLAPGSYIFRVQSTDIRGNWNSNPAEFHFEIASPFWKRWWAFGIYIGLTFIILYSILTYTNRLTELKNNLKLEKINREKEEEIHHLKLSFFTNISHDLRTPLTLIIGSVKRLIKKEGFPAEAKNGLEVIENNANLLLRLSNELLDFRKIETGNLKLKVSFCNIIAFVKEAYLSFYGHAMERNIEYEFVCAGNEMPMWIDTGQMEKVIFNLLSNAFKFTPDNGKIKILLQNKSEEEIILAVCNTGQILTENQIKRIFERFYQTDESMKDGQIGPGTGIGLSIVKDIVMLHKGSIDVQSTAEQGTSFIISLLKGNDHFKADEFADAKEVDDPVYYKSGSSDYLKVTEAPSNPFYGSSLLIVEDNHELRKFLKSSLEYHYTVYEAENGVQALSVVHEKLPDLVLSDVMMPEMDGISLCFSLKSNIKTSHIPVILLTAKNTTFYKIKGLETGADDYIGKPFSEDELHLRIRNILKTREELRRKFMLEASIKPEFVKLNSPDGEFLENLNKIIEANLDVSDLKAEQISQELTMSHSLVYKKLKAVTGMSIVEYVRDFRLKKAEMFLMQNKMTISEICYHVGFNDRNYFSYWFKKKYKSSPREYLKQKLGNSRPN